MKIPTILMVDDDPSFLKALSYQVRAMGFDVVTEESAGNALEHFSETAPELSYFLHLCCRISRSGSVLRSVRGQ